MSKVTIAALSALTGVVVMGYAMKPGALRALPPAPVVAPIDYERLAKALKPAAPVAAPVVKAPVPERERVKVILAAPVPLHSVGYLAAMSVLHHEVTSAERNARLVEERRVRAAKAAPVVKAPAPVVRYVVAVPSRCVCSH